MFISDFAIKRPLITVVAMVALVIFGAFALMKLKTDEFPDVAPPWLTVGVIYPGASPGVVEKEVLDPIEEQVGSIAGVADVQTFGKVARELTVEIVSSRLQAAGVSVSQVVQALQLQNLAAPVGRVTGALDERSIRLL